MGLGEEGTGHGHSLFSQHMSRKSEYNFFQFFTPFSKQRCLSSLLLLLFQGPVSADQVLGSSFTLIDFQLLGLNYFMLSEVSGEFCLKFYMTIQLVFLSVLCPVPSALLEVFFACSFFFLCFSFLFFLPFSVSLAFFLYLLFHFLPFSSLSILHPLEDLAPQQPAPSCPSSPAPAPCSQLTLYKQQKALDSFCFN